MSSTNTITILLLFCPCPCCIWLRIVYEPSKHSFKYKKCAKGQRNCCLRCFSVRFWQLLKKKAFLQQENWQLRERLARIDDKMTEIEDLKNKVMLVKNAVDNNNQKTTESSTNNLTFYHSVLFNEALTTPNHPVKSDKLLGSFKSIVKDFDFDLLGPFQLVNFPTKDFVGKNLIEL